MAKQGRNWQSPEAIEALRQRLLEVRRRYGRAFSLSAMANNTGVSIEIIKGFARAKTHPKATTPREHKHFDAIADYLDSFEGDLSQEGIHPGLSHPNLSQIMTQYAPDDFILGNFDCRGLYVGMAVGRRSQNLFTSVLAIAKTENNRIDYAEHDANAYSGSIEGQCAYLSGRLILFGASRDVESIQLTALRSYGVLADGRRLLAGGEYHTGIPGGFSSAARVIFVQLPSGGIGAPLMDTVLTSEAFKLLCEIQQHGGLPEDVAWGRLQDVFAQMMAVEVAEAAIYQSKNFIGRFDQASFAI